MVQLQAPPCIRLRLSLGVSNIGSLLHAYKSWPTRVLSEHGPQVFSFQMCLLCPKLRRWASKMT